MVKWEMTLRIPIPYCGYRTVLDDRYHEAWAISRKLDNLKGEGRTSQYFESLVITLHFYMKNHAQRSIERNTFSGAQPTEINLQNPNTKAHEISWVESYRGYPSSVFRSLYPPHKFGGFC